MDVVWQLGASIMIPGATASLSRRNLIAKVIVAADWLALGTNTVTDDSGAVKITYVDNAFGAQLDFDGLPIIHRTLTNGKTYNIVWQQKVEGLASIDTYFDRGSTSDILYTNEDSTSFITRSATTSAIDDSTQCRIFFQGMTTGRNIWIKNISISENY